MAAQRIPSAEDCTACKTLAKNANGVIFATFDYPQMGGYCSRSIVESAGVGDCFDVAIWHDGEFPFDDGRPPTGLHHCDPMQFVSFGLTVIEKQMEVGRSQVNDHSASMTQHLRAEIERARELLAKLEAM